MVGRFVDDDKFVFDREPQYFGREGYRPHRITGVGHEAGLLDTPRLPGKRPDNGQRLMGQKCRGRHLESHPGHSFIDLSGLPTPDQIESLGDVELAGCGQDEQLIMVGTKRTE